jgi:hypothetical protein
MKGEPDKREEMPRHLHRAPPGRQWRDYITAMWQNYNVAATSACSKLFRQRRPGLGWLQHAA